MYRKHIAVLELYGVKFVARHISSYALGEVTSQSLYGHDTIAILWV